jgi:glutathione S-transferase
LFQSIHYGENVLKIWGRTNSINVQKVMWAAAELGIEYQHTDAGRQFGIINEPWYRGMNPNGLVPTIQDDDLVLWESNAIVRYLAAKYGDGQLYPARLEARANADRWMDWCTSTFAPVMSPVFHGLIRTPPEQRDAKTIDAACVRLSELAATLDAHFAGRHFITGDSMTMGDIPLGCYIHRWYALPIERPVYANLAAWHARLSERPAFRQHVMLPLS